MVTILVRSSKIQDLQHWGPKICSTIHTTQAYNDNYSNKHYFSDFDEVLSEFELVQIVKFETWSRLVGPERRSSILDHFYIKNPMLISNVKYSFFEHILEHINAPLSGIYWKIEKCRSKD